MAVPLPGYLAQVNLTSGASVGGVNLVLTDSGDAKTFNGTVGAAHQFVDQATTLHVQTSTDNGVTWSSNLATNLYTVTRYLTPQVVLNSALTSGTVYLVRLSSFNYFAYTTIAQATDIVFQGAAQMLDATVLQGPSGAGWSSFQPGLNGGKFVCKTWELSTGATIFTNHLANGDLLAVQFQAPDGTHASAGMCSVSDSNIAAAVNTLVAEDLTFQITGMVSLT